MTAEESDDGVHVGDDVLDRHAHHAKAAFRECTIAMSVSVLLREVHATVASPSLAGLLRNPEFGAFHDEPSRGSQEVDDEGAKDDLPTKPDAELSAP